MTKRAKERNSLLQNANAQTCATPNYGKGYPTVKKLCKDILSHPEKASEFAQAALVADQQAAVLATPVQVVAPTTYGTVYQNPVAQTGAQGNYQINNNSGQMLQWFGGNGSLNPNTNAPFNVGDIVQGYIDTNGNLNFQALNSSTGQLYNTAWSASYFNQSGGGGYYGGGYGGGDNNMYNGNIAAQEAQFFSCDGMASAFER